MLTDLRTSLYEEKPVQELPSQNGSNPSRFARRKFAKTVGKENLTVVDRDKNTSEHWKLSPLAKYSDKGVVRCVHPRATIHRATAVLRQAGITRIADVTHLDRVGIPNFMSVRPLDLDPGSPTTTEKARLKMMRMPAPSWKESSGMPVNIVPTQSP